MTKTLHGKIRGKSIELDEDIGMADGQEVEVQVTLLQPGKKWGEGILRSAGGWAQHPELDDVFEKIQRDRKIERTPQMSEE